MLSYLTAQAVSIKHHDKRERDSDTKGRMADALLEDIESGKSVIYAPGKWWLIMMIIRHMPKFLFNKIDI